MMMFRTLMTPSLVSWAATSPLLVGMFLSALHTKKTWIRRFASGPIGLLRRRTPSYPVAVLWSRSRPELDILAGAGENEPAPG